MISVPHFTLPRVDWIALAAIMPIAIATIPESTAHVFQLDIYVNDLAKKKGTGKTYDIGDRLGSNLFGDATRGCDRPSTDLVSFTELEQPLVV